MAGSAPRGFRLPSRSGRRTPLGCWGGDADDRGALLGRREGPDAREWRVPLRHLRPSRRCSSGRSCAGSARRRATRRCTASECGVDPAVHDDRAAPSRRSRAARSRSPAPQRTPTATTRPAISSSRPERRGERCFIAVARRVVAHPAPRSARAVSRRRTRSRSRPGVMGSKRRATRSSPTSTSSAGSPACRA
jgi:hypothetical protein